MKKLCVCLGAVVASAILLGGCFNGGNVKGVVSEDLIELSQNAQYLPSRDLLVANNTKAFSVKSGDVAPEMLLNGGFSQAEYDGLIDSISPIDTPFNREFTVSDAKNEVIKVLTQGVLFDDWFSYQEGELAGYGKYFVSEKDNMLTVTRLSSFQPWVYDAESGQFLDNGDFSSNIPNYPVRSDNYLKISIYTDDNGKEVVECEVAENLSYYNEVTPVSYQFMRNVRDTSFTKIQITSRSTVPSKQHDGSWGYDINTNLPYGYMRNFTQLDYSSPDDIKWLNATQLLPYAFDLRAEYDIKYGCRSEEGGFSYTLRSVFNEGEFSYQPSQDYLTVKLDDIVYLSAFARLSNSDTNYDKNYWIEDGNENFYDNSEMLTAELQSTYNSQITSVLESLKNLNRNTSVSSDIINYDCTAKHTAFEKVFSTYLNTASKTAIDGSNLVKNFMNNDTYELFEKSVLPA